MNRKVRPFTAIRVSFFRGDPLSYLNEDPRLMSGRGFSTETRKSHE